MRGRNESPLTELLGQLSGTPGRAIGEPIDARVEAIDWARVEAHLEAVGRFA